MKNILKLSLALCLMSAGVQSCTEANAKHHHDEASKCIGSKPCKACKANIVTAAVNVACVVGKQGL